MSTQKTYNIHKGSEHEQFLNLRNKVQVFGGGFANGKTTATVIKVLQLAKDYPGSTGLIGRATYDKLNDTIRKVFFEWCPEEWIEEKWLSASKNMVILKNGSQIWFRHIHRTGTGDESSSKMLSATYDYIAVDQVEDPEITHQDYLDLFGRLRGQTPYRGDDPTMPKSGPRWMILTMNPKRNWVYNKIIKPVHDNAKGLSNPDYKVGSDGVPIVGIIEGSTYINKANLPADFIEGLETMYSGSMSERFLMGQWAGYEGLIYPMFDENQHVIEHGFMLSHLKEIRASGYWPTIVEGLDYGIAKPTCYLLGFVDNFGNIMNIDGFYKSEMSIDQIAAEIKAKRARYELATHGNLSNTIRADPSIFKRAGAQRKTTHIETVGSILIKEFGIECIAGDNNTHQGISKVRSLLSLAPFHRHPISGNFPAPWLYFSSDLSFVRDEFMDYYWAKDKNNAALDIPQDKNDHAMDALKYQLSSRPIPGQFKASPAKTVPAYMRWSVGAPTDARRARHRSLFSR